MGGTDALHLGLKYPDVFSVVAPMSASTYDWQHDPVWGTARDSLFFLPPKIEDLKDIPFAARFIIAAAAATAPNPDKPPFYLDMPFQFVDGRAQIVSEVFRKENALDPINDVHRYIAQPIKLRGLLIYNDTDNGDYQEEVDFVPRSVGRFCETLTRLGVPHQCAMVNASHCGYDFSPVLELMGAHLSY